MSREPGATSLPGRGRSVAANRWSSRLRDHELEPALEDRGDLRPRMAQELARLPEQGLGLVVAREAELVAAHRQRPDWIARRRRRLRGREPVSHSTPDGVAAPASTRRRVVGPRCTRLHSDSARIRRSRRILSPHPTVAVDWSTSRRRGSAIGAAAELTLRAVSASHRSRDVALGEPARQQLADFAPRLADRAAEKRQVVLILQMRGQQPHRGQVQPSLGEHGEDDRKAARGAGRSHAVEGSVLGAMQRLAAVDEQRAEAAGQVKPATLELDEVRRRARRWSPGSGRREHQPGRSTRRR